MAKKWSDLSRDEQSRVTRLIASRVKALAGAKYRIVQGDDQYQREGGIPETVGEDAILDKHRRGRLLDLTRNAVRNSATFSAILKQLQSNVVGVHGGKAIFDFEGAVPEADAQAIRRGFADWTRSCEFHDGLNLNTTLKLLLSTYVVNGDMVLVYDDGLVEDSGKILCFESDEIVEVAPEVVERKYGKGYTQSLGRVYSPNGRLVGVVVSRSERGNPGYADPSHCYFLRRDPDASPFDSFWMMPRNIWRFEQGRGVTSAAPSLSTILDCEDLCGFELQAAKKNAQTFAQIVETQSVEPEIPLPSPFGSDVDFSKMSDSQIEEAASQVAEESTERTVTLEAARSAGIIYEQMPEGHKMELLDTKHPNDSLVDFVKWLAGRSASVFGLTQQYATLAATGKDYKAERLLAEPVFQEGQKFLEQICDWLFVKWYDWAKPSDIPHDELLPLLSWRWPSSAELDEYTHQMALALKFQNLTGSFREYYGNDWREKLQQIKVEADWCKANGIPHPAYKMVSGGERTGADQVNVDQVNADHPHEGFSDEKV